MSGEGDYGDCRDSCMSFVIEGDYACSKCIDVKEEESQGEEEYYFGEGSQG